LLCFIIVISNLNANTGQTWITFCFVEEKNTNNDMSTVQNKTTADR